MELIRRANDAVLKNEPSIDLIKDMRQEIVSLTLEMFRMEDAKHD